MLYTLCTFIPNMHIHIYTYIYIGVGAITPNCVMVEFMDTWHTTTTTSGTGTGATSIGGGFGNGIVIRLAL